ncbi:MAG: SLBB domain-containing protein [Candidatus Saganbacteria bacterium]|nr:SLBB domain-containing protein [Candidatus Saganbacteria bacterium]
MLRITTVIVFLSFLLQIFAPCIAASQLSLSPVSTPVKNVPIISVPQGTSANAVPQVAISENYILGPGDQMEAHLIVANNALILDYTLLINPQGEIYFPNIGEIMLAGLSLKDAKAVILKQIKAKYKESLNFSLLLVIPKRINVYVTGQIDDPGLYEVYDGTRIADILKQVGMAKGGSDLNDFVYLKRKSADGTYHNFKLVLYEVFLENDARQNVRLEYGDIISVPAIRSYVYVYGEVGNSGTYGYVPGQTLSDYINIAGGPSTRANLARVSVTRYIEGASPKSSYIDASKILYKGLSQNDIGILAGDVINVPGKFFYFSDFGSLAAMIFTGIALYNTLVTR